MLVLITGGARSGKSRFAEEYAAAIGARGTYVATSRIWDGEMRDRVRLHQEQREQSGFPWTTVEEPLALADTLRRLGTEAAGERGSPSGGCAANVIMVDCLTLWLTNLLLEDGTEEWTRKAMDLAASKVERELDRLCEVLTQIPVPVFMVTNEVGDGIVPEYPLGRLFRDLAGRMNQRLAALCREVFLVTAGIPVELKSRAFRLPDWPAADRPS